MTHAPFVDLKVPAQAPHDEFDAVLWFFIDRAAYTVGPELEQLIGNCDRLHNLQAALLSVKLARLAGWNEARREAAKRYNSTI